MSGPGLQLLTPAGPAGVAVFRVSGSMQKEVLGRLGLGAVAPGAARLVRPRLGGEILDEGLLVGCPHGQVELHVHGSPALIQRLLETFQATDQSDAPATLESLALMRVASAPSAEGARLLLDQGAGALRLAFEQALADPHSKLAQGLLDDWARQRFWLRPARVVLVGPVNAGKSTLFNLLIGERHALTSPEEGTTRDAVEGRGRLGSWPILWVDTAGERPGAPLAVERAGQAQARSVAQRADLVLRLVPEEGLEGADQTPESEAHEVTLRSRGDRAGGQTPGDQRGIDVIAAPEEAKRLIAARVLDALGLPFHGERTQGRAALFDQTQAEALMALMRQDPLPLGALLHISD